MPRPSSIAELRAIAQPREYSPSITDRLYRLGSIYVSIPLARVGATPNRITVAWIVLGLAAVALVASESWLARIGGALLLQLSYLLDYVDGEVARLTGRKSAAGEFLDLVGHGLVKTSLPLGVGWSAAVETGSGALLAAGALGAVAIAVGDTLRFYAACVSGALGAGDLGHVVPVRMAGKRWSPLGIGRAAFALSFESPGLYALTLVAALADAMALLAVWWAVAGHVWWISRAHRYARRLDTPPAVAAIVGGRE
ncbi:MAG: CDP-alcohol phosphatidyltransferase family protein [Candidatus Rokubacteria bacterium]|nr:CDP-alcohol phosphatidyltransferase family protein [Candidatus Rokubacteria bacterium]